MKLTTLPYIRYRSTFNIRVFQHRNVTCAGRKTKVPSEECKHLQHWKEAWLGLLYSYRSAMSELFVASFLQGQAVNLETIKWTSINMSNELGFILRTYSAQIAIA
jgi:hypothetical protein